MSQFKDVTVIVVPRERFSRSIESLESIYKNTQLPFRLIYVDGNSPRRVQRALEKRAREHRFTLLRVDRYLVPNEARNLGLSHANTDYVVFIDNDVIVTPGWLHHLHRCAEETGAALVIPLFLEGNPGDGIVHMAGGTAQIDSESGGRRFKNVHRFFGRKVNELAAELRREPTGSIEYHCLLARREVLERVGRLDEKIPSVWEHTDLALAVRELGEAIYFEPNAVVSYDSAGGLKWSDVPYFAIRWSDVWGQMSIDRFSTKWALSIDDPDVKAMYRYPASYRRHFMRRLFRIDPSLRGRRLTTPAVLLLDKVLQHFSRIEISKWSRSLTCVEEDTFNDPEGLGFIHSRSTRTKTDSLRLT